MKDRILFATWLLVSLIIVAPFAAPTAAQETTPESSAASSPLLDMLRFVPDIAGFREYITYGDEAAWYRSWGFQPIADRETLLGLSDANSPLFPAWTQIMPRQTTPPDFLGLNYFRVDDMRGFYGFDVFNVDRYLQAGLPPSWIGVVDLKADPAQIGAALTASGYTKGTLDGGAALYSLHGDYEVTLGQSGPRVGQLGGLNRIALLGQQMIVARATQVAQGALLTRSGAIPSLADNPVYVAGVTALDDPSLANRGELVGAILVDGSMFASDTMCTRSAAYCDAIAQQMAAHPLAAFDLAVFATYHTPGHSSLALALVFPEGADAQGAAVGLAARIKNYQSVVTRQPFLDFLQQHNAAFESAVAAEANGRPVVLAVIQQNDPSLMPDASGRVQASVLAWYEMVSARDTLYLEIGG